MRHTAATLMLAAGENPEWVASILGHSTTEMLFRVYSRFVPNLTRNDGMAFAGLMHARLYPKPPHKHAAAEPTVAANASVATADLASALRTLQSLTPEQLAAVMALIPQQD
jgi:integrase